MTIPRLIDEKNITPQEDTEIRSLLCAAFPKDANVFSKTRAWNGSGPSYSSIIEQPDERGYKQIIAHIGVVDRTITVGTQKIKTAGIQNVSVHPQHRGQGLTEITMKQAMTEAAKRNFDLGLLFCGEGVAKLYTRLGWILLPQPQITRIHEGTPQPLAPNNLTMFYPLKLTKVPPGPIHLNGDDW
jgi:predicted N-acetyltransferase YhbS